MRFIFDKKKIYLLFYLILFQWDCVYNIENTNNQNDTKAVSFLLAGVMGVGLLNEFIKDAYSKLSQWINYYFNHKKNLKYFFCDYSKKFENFSKITLDDFIMQKSKINQLNKFFSQFSESVSLKSNKMLIETESTEDKNFLAEEILFIKTIANSMKLNLVEINIGAINALNINKFLKSLRHSLKKNQFFLLNIDALFQESFLNDEYRLSTIINLFNEFPESVICLKINKNLKLSKNIIKNFSDPIVYYKTSESDIVNYLKQVINLHQIKLKNIELNEIAKLLLQYSYYEFLYVITNVLNISIKNNNILSQNILLDQIRKCNIILNNVVSGDKNYVEEPNDYTINESALSKNLNAQMSFKYINNFKLNDIPGYDEVKKKLLKIISKIKKNPWAKLPALLFYGPAGTGKTKLMQAVANELGFPIVIVNSGLIMSKYSGETEKNIAYLFEFARKNAPCILLIDEIDSLLEERDDVKMKGNFVNEFISELDGVKELNGVLLIGATNRLNKIDSAVLRPGRIDKKILIDYPDQNDREQIINYYFKKYNFKYDNDINIIDIVEQLNGFSGADIKAFCMYMEDVLDELNSNDNEIIINKKILIETYKKFKEENQKNDFKFIYIKDKKLADIAGYDSIKEEMKVIINELKEQNYKKTKMEGVILTGLPGTGKTNFARVLASESKVSLLILNQSDLIGKYVGDSEEKLIKLFENIKKNSPCIVFIDEMESLFSHRANNRGESYADKISSNIINTFLYNIDGINSLKGVLFIGATNFIDKIDPALIRAGRMSNIIHIPIPQYRDRLEIIKYYIQKNNIMIDTAISIEYLAERTNGMTPAEIEQFIDLTAKLGKKEDKISIDQALISEAVQQMLLGKKNNDLIMNNDTLNQTAYHEACHGILQYILFRNGHSSYKFDFLTIEPRQNTLGVAYGRVPAEYLPGTKERYLGYIATALAGKAAQKIFFNSEDSGAANDLQMASEAALDMVISFGMGTKLRVFNINSIDNKKEIDIEVENILQNQYQKVLDFITEYKDLIIDIVDKLFEKKILYEKEMETLIHNYEKKTNKKVIYLL